MYVNGQYPNIVTNSPTMFVFLILLAPPHHKYVSCQSIGSISLAMHVFMSLLLNFRRVVRQPVVPSSYVGHKLMGWVCGYVMQ